MAESRIKDENYYNIQGFMINRLGLKGVQLSVYAIIYGFSQDGETEFTGSLQYLCDFTGGTSKPTIIKALKELVECGYLLRREEVINGVQFNRYKANLPLLKNLYHPMQETLSGAVKKVNGGSKKSLPNNNINNASDSIGENKVKYPANIISLLRDYSKGNAEVVELLLAWLDVRKAKRAAITTKAIELNLRKLDRLASESNMTVIAYLQEIICRGWQAFYPINYGGGKTVGANGIAVGSATNDLEEVFR